MSFVRRLAPALLAICLLVTSMVASGLLPASTPLVVRAEAAAPSTSASHPYGDPVWFPLRTPAAIGCAKSGCGTSADHGYFAIDFIGTEGDPVYAAGAGIAHIGGTSGSCSSASSEVGRGRWVWIDHGGGLVSQYRHLSSIAVHDGDLVTPATRIGAMGHSGDFSPCRTSYLHFEVRQGGVSGELIDFGSLRGCVGGREVSLPETFGYPSWNDPGMHPWPRLSSPRLDSGCIEPEWLQTLQPVQPRLVRTAGALQVSVSLPAGASSWLAQVEVWRPSLDQWRPVPSPEVPATATTTRFTGLEDDHRYRVRVGLHNAGGWSAWSRSTDAVGAPAAPRSPRFLSWKHRSSSTKSYLHYGWYRPADLGSAVTTYEVARRCGSSTASYGSWKSYRQGKKDIYRNLRGLKKVEVCQVKVRATNGVGTGPWSRTSTIRR